MTLNSYRDYIESLSSDLFGGKIDNIIDNNSFIEFSGNTQINDPNKFLQYLHKIYTNEFKIVLKITIYNDNDIDKLVIANFDELNLLSDDILLLKMINKISLKIAKDKLKQLYIDKYNIQNEVNLDIYYNEDNLRKKIDNNSNYLEDILDKNKYTIFLIVNYKDSIICGAFSIINESKLTDNLIEERKNDFFTNLEKRKEEIYLRNELCNWVDGSKWMIPYYLRSECNNKENHLFKKINRYCCDLIIKSIANLTMEINGQVNSIFIATKRVEVNFDISEYISECIENMYDLYIWIYSSSSADKINFARNIIVSVIVAKCQGNVYNLILKNSDWILKSSKEAYNEFIGKSIEAYFENRLMLVEKIKENISDVNKGIDELLSKINSNIFTLIASVATGLLTYSLDDNSSLKIMKVILVGYSILLGYNAIIVIPNILREFYYINRLYKENISKYKIKFEVISSIKNEEKLYESNKRVLLFMSIISIIIIIVLVVFLLIIVFRKGLLEKIINKI